MKEILITGCAGFIGYHLSDYLLKQGCRVIGVDAITDYYDTKLKENRLSHLMKNENFIFYKNKIEDTETLLKLFCGRAIDQIVHLAAQAGVRYSIENPKEYVNTNIVGTYSIFELAKELKIQHLLAASTSSVYGDNSDMPFAEDMKCDTQLSYYAATKKSNEVIGHA